MAIKTAATASEHRSTRRAICRAAILQFDEVWGFIGKKERHLRLGDDLNIGLLKSDFSDIGQNGLLGPQSGYLMARNPELDLEQFDPGIRRAVGILLKNGIDTLSSCEGRTNPGYLPERDGPHHGDWPYVIIHGTAADAFIALGAVLREGLPVRSVEQSWFVYPENPTVPVGPQWRMTFWKKDSNAK